MADKMGRRGCLLSQEPCASCSAVGIIGLKQSTTIRKPGLPGKTLEEAVQLLWGEQGMDGNGSTREHPL